MILSLYGLYVEVQHDLQPSFEAMCDINPTISCSAAFLSDYGKGFGILPPQLALRNPIFGILFYLTMLVLVLLPPERPLYTQAILALAIIANLSTLYLGYILAFVLHVACVVCITIYVVNFIILILAYRRQKLVTHSVSRNMSKRRD